MKESIKVLLERRKQILEQINSLEAEYKALGIVITELHNYKEKENKQKEKEKYGKEYDD